MHMRIIAIVLAGVLSLFNLDGDGYMQPTVTNVVYNVAPYTTTDGINFTAFSTGLSGQGGPPGGQPINVALWCPISGQVTYGPCAPGAGLGTANTFTQTQTAPTWAMTNGSRMTDDGQGIYLIPPQGAAATLHIIGSPGDQIVGSDTETLAWTNAASVFGTVDTGVSRSAAGIVAIGNGTTGDRSGTVSAAAYMVGGTAGVTKTCTSAIVVVSGIITSCT